MVPQIMPSFPSHWSSCVASAPSKSVSLLPFGALQALQPAGEQPSSRTAVASVPFLRSSCPPTHQLCSGGSLCVPLTARTAGSLPPTQAFSCVLR